MSETFYVIGVGKGGDVLDVVTTSNRVSAVVEFNNMRAALDVEETVTIWDVNRGEKMWSFTRKE